MNAHTPFFDMVCEVPVCIDGDLEFGDSAQDQELMRGFAEYFHDMVFGWRGFDDMNQLCDLQMLLHGPGILAWEDPYDWRPKPILAGNFYVPSETNASLDNCEMAMVVTPMTAGQLWRKIDGVKAPGWDEEAVKQCIIDSARADSEMRTWRWDRWEQAFKNGDIYISQTQTKSIQLFTLFVEEMDGTISQKIIQSGEGKGGKKFLYDSPSRYDSWDQCLCLFPYDIGADGTYHSIKGLGTDIYPFTVLLNNIDNSIADLVTSGIKPMWQPSSAGDLSKFQMVKWGGGNMVPNGINPLQLNIGSSIVPAMEVSRGFNNTLAQNTAAAMPQDLSAPTVEETAKSAMIRAAERAKITKGLHNRYMRGKDRQYAEMWRRAVNPKLRKHHQGSKEALRFQDRCYALCDRLGVDRKALQAVDNIRANRSLGLGSAAMRIEIANQLMANIDRFDEIGQNEVKRMFVATMTSFHSVDSIVPSLTTGRDATNDNSIAELENNALNTGGKAVLSLGQNHVIHAESHIASMEEDAALCQQGQQEPEDCQQRLENKGTHVSEHLAALQSNPTRQAEFKQFSARLNALASMQDQLQQQLEEQAQAQADMPQPGAPSPEMAKVEMDAELKRMKMEYDQQRRDQKQQFDMAQKAQQAQFDRALKDAETAAKIRRDSATAAPVPTTTE